YVCTVRHAQHPTRFPYTTLFRSDFLAFDAPHDVAVGLRRTTPAVEHDGLALVGGHDDVLVVGHDAQELHRQNLDDVVDVHHVALDRKSTRLNSSHVKISYAVFCL